MRISLRKMRVAQSLAAVLVLMGLDVALAADHIDSPRVNDNAFTDITDVYVFRNPADASRLVIAMNLFSPVGQSDASKLFENEDRAEYGIFIDTDGDVDEDHKIRITFHAGPGGEQMFRMQGVPGAGDIEGQVSTGGNAIVVGKDGALAFAGLRDDPFFFDFEAFNRFVSDPCVPTAGLRCPGTGSPADFFLGLNVAAIVVEFSLTELPNIERPSEGEVGVWAKTFVKQSS